MNTPHANELPSSTEHISAVPKPDRRRRHVDVADQRRAADRLWPIAVTAASPIDASAVEPLRIPA